MTANVPNPATRPPAIAAGLSAPGVFRVDGRDVTVDVVLAAAEWRGELAAFRERWQAVEAMAARAEASGLTPEPAAVESATDNFRYARDLVSAEECDRWLAARGLTFADLTSLMGRRVQSELVAGQRPPREPSAGAAGTGSGVPAGIASDRFLADALLADEFTGWARGLAWRAALACEERALLPATSRPEESWADWEQRYQSACAALAKPERRQRELGTRRLELIHVELLVAEFADLEAAREACLCAREDGSPLEAVARANGLPSSVWKGFFGDLSPEWQRSLMGASPGDVTPPLSEGDNAVVLQLRARREPSPDDPAVGRRLDAAVRRQHFGRLEARHIRWLMNVDLEATA